MRENQKTSNFLKAIEKYANEQLKETKTQLEIFRKKELEKAEVEALKDAYYLIQKEIAQMKKGIASQVSKKEREGKRILFKKRQQIMKDVFKSAEEKILEYTKNSEYLKTLKNQVDIILDTLKDDNTIFFIREEDLNLKAKLLDSLKKGITFKVDKNIKLGGILGFNKDMGLIIDETFDTKLKEQHEWFLENSNLEIF